MINYFKCRFKIITFIIALFALFLIIKSAVFKPDTVEATNNPKSYKENEILVKYKKGVSAKKREDISGRIGAKKIKSFNRLKVDHIKLKQGTTVDEAIDFYESKSEVEYAQPNFRKNLQAIPIDTSFNSLWGLNNTGQNVNGTSGTSDADIDAAEAWDITTGSNEVVVAVLDTGVNYNHLDLEPNMWTNPGEIPGNSIDDDNNGYVDDYYGINTASTLYPPGDPMGTESHGTHVAGTIGAKGNNGIGVTGVNWNVKIMAVNIFSDDGYGYTDDEVEAIDYLINMKARGVNIVAGNASYGSNSFDSAEYDGIIQLRNAGILFVTAAGNGDDNGNGLNNDVSPFYPAGYNIDNIISVAATNSSDNLASFSNYGSTSVDIAAPGVDILSSVLSNDSIESSVIEGSDEYQAYALQYSGTTGAEGIIKPVYDCGKGLTAESFPSEVSGNIALIERGDITFNEKVTRAQSLGAAGVIIYNNSPTSSYNNFTLGTPGDWIPVVSVSQADGQALIAKGNPVVTLISSLSANAYQFYDGTSMATPHVTGVAALVAGYYPEYDYLDIKEAILSGGDMLPSLEGKIATGARLNAYNALNQPQSPKGTLSINAGQIYAKSRNITLSLESDQEMQNSIALAESESGLDSAEWTNFDQFSSGNKAGTVSYTFQSTGEGQKTIFAKIINTNALESFLPISDSIFLDTATPYVSFSSKAKPAGSYIRQLYWLPVNASDSPSGLERVEMLHKSGLKRTYYGDRFPHQFRLDSTLISNGPQIFYIKAFDKAGNVKQISRSYNIDNYKPRTYAPKKAIAKKGTYVKLYFKVIDPFSPRAKVKIVIKNTSGNVVDELYVGEKPTGDTLRYFLYKALLPIGKYRFLIYATDKAGNTQFNNGFDFLYIK